jgi:hypothetical protein
VYSRFVEKPLIWSWEPNPSFLRCFYHSWHQSKTGVKHTPKHLKITITLWGTLSTYKDHSSLLRWQANLIVPLCNYGIASLKVHCDFGVLAFFSCLWRLFWLFVALVEILGLCLFLCCLWSFGCLCLAFRAWSGYESAGSLGAWMGTKVLDPLRVYVEVGDYCDTSSAGTLTCVKTLVTVLRAFCHRVWTIHKGGSFLLFSWGRLGRVCIASSHLIQEA